MMEKIKKYLAGVKKELKKVKWPTKELTISYTKMVIIMSLVVAIFLGSLDFLFNYLITMVI